MSKAASGFQMRVLQTHLSGTIGANATKLVVVESSTLHAPAWTPLIRKNAFFRVSGDGRAANSTAVRMMRIAMTILIVNWLNQNCQIDFVPAEMDIASNAIPSVRVHCLQIVL